MKVPIKDMALKAQRAQRHAKTLGKEVRQAALEAIANSLLSHEESIITANAIDLKNAVKAKLSSAMIDRLHLTKERIHSMAEDVIAISKQPEVLGKITDEHTRPDGLIIKRESIPLGVIGMIFESRPNVIVDAAALAIKSGNAMILKGGKEANESNTILGHLIRAAIKNSLPRDIIVVLDSKNRSLVSALITLKGVVDVIIPRGGEALVNFVYDHAKVPVIAHFKGLCHTYVDASANLAQAKAVVLNAKTSRPGVCNAMETLLLHEDLPNSWIESTLEALTKKGVEIRLSSDLRQDYPMYKEASCDDWDEEYLDLVLSVKRVKDVNNAIEHIERHGTYHTEAILAENADVIKQFQTRVDCSCIVINASSRFNDGGQLGLGAELGISTSKLHAYGPMGAAEMTTTRYVVTGSGHIR